MYVSVSVSVSNDTVGETVVSICLLVSATCVVGCIVVTISVEGA